MGKVNGKPVSDKMREANRANAQRPRLRVHGEAKRRAKRTLANILPLATRGVAQFIRDCVDPKTGHLIGGRDTFEPFMTAVRFAAEHGGLPRVTEQHAMIEGLPQVLFRTEGFQPPWELPEADTTEGDGASSDGAGGKSNGHTGH